MAQQSSQGFLTSVPCPFCSVKMDLSGFVEQALGGTAEAAFLEKGSTVECDACRKKSRVAAIKPTVIIKLAVPKAGRDR